MLVEPGSLTSWKTARPTPANHDKRAADLVNYMVYMSGAVASEA